MFAYCGNNPISRSDSSGYFFFTVLGATVGAVFGALDARIQGKTGDEFTAMVVSGAVSGAVSGLAADVLTFTGATVGVAVGVMAVAGAIGSLAGTRAEEKITGIMKSDDEKYSEMVADAALNGLFAYMGGPVTSQMGKVVKKGFWTVAKNIYAQELKSTVGNVVEEALTTVTAGMAKFVGSAYWRAFSKTAEIWFN